MLEANTVGEVFISKLFGFANLNTGETESGKLSVRCWDLEHDGNFVIYKSVAPIYQLLSYESLYRFMLGKRIAINTDFFHANFELSKFA